MPERWEVIRESACVAKQQVASLQANEIAAVRKKLGSFELRQLQFRDEFRLWDYSYVIRSSVDNWKTTHWKEIDVELMEIECKHFAKKIRGLDKEMRAWDAYVGLDASVRDLLTSLKVHLLLLFFLLHH